MVNCFLCFFLRSVHVKWNKMADWVDIQCAEFLSRLDRDRLLVFSAWSVNMGQSRSKFPISYEEASKRSKFIGLVWRLVQLALRTRNSNVKWSVITPDPYGPLIKLVLLHCWLSNRSSWGQGPFTSCHNVTMSIHDIITDCWAQLEICRFPLCCWEVWIRPLWLLVS